jgi:hypothetical protein
VTASFSFFGCLTVIINHNKKQKTMKTASRILLSLGLILFFAGMTFAQVASTTTPAKTSTKQDVTAPGKFVDNDKNGTCDKHDAKGTCTQGKNFVDKNGDGKCDNCGCTGKCDGTGCGKGQKNAAECGKSQGKGSCSGQGQKQGNGCAKPCGNAPAAQPNK